MKIYLDLQKQAITKTTDENIYQGDIYSNAFEILFYNYTDSNWFPTMSQLAPNGRKAGEFTADALEVGESHEVTEDGVTYLKFDFTMGTSWVLMKGRSEFYIWFNRLGGAIVQKKCVGVVNVMIDQSTTDYFIADPTFNPNVKAYIDACIAELGDGSPKYFDTASNIANCTEDKGLAVATDTGHLYYWDETKNSTTKYTDSGLVYNDLSAYYTITQMDALLAQKVNKADVADNLTTNDSDKVLSAKQGKVLKDTIDTLDDSKADKADTYTKQEVNSALALKADKSDTYTKMETDGKLALKADKFDTYTRTVINNFIADLETRKANKSNTYTKEEIDTTINGIGEMFGLIERAIGKLESVQNVVDVVATKSALNSYDTSKLEENDKIQVIADETHDGASTIYNWSGSAWQYVGAYGTNSYTKQESDNKFAPKTTAVTHTGNQLKDYNGNNIYPNLDAKTQVKIDNAYGPAYVGKDTSTNILAKTSNQGIWIGSDTGNWYYWNGTAYVSGGTYQATQIADDAITFDMINKSILNKYYFTATITSGSQYGSIYIRKFPNSSGNKIRFLVGASSYYTSFTVYGYIGSSATNLTGGSVGTQKEFTLNNTYDYFRITFNGTPSEDVNVNCIFVNLSILGNLTSEVFNIKTNSDKIPSIEEDLTKIPDYIFETTFTDLVFLYPRIYVRNMRLNTGDKICINAISDISVIPYVYGYIGSTPYLIGQARTYFSYYTLTRDYDHLEIVYQLQTALTEPTKATVICVNLSLDNLTSRIFNISPDLTLSYSPNVLVIGDSYSQLGTYLTKLSNLVSINRIVNLGVGSATLKDKYTDRKTYPYTDNPTQSDNTGNHNTFACQIEKLKANLSTYYPTSDLYPNLIIIQGGNNDGQDNSTDNYINEIYENKNNVYYSIYGNTEQGNIVKPINYQNTNRTNFCGAMKYLRGELLSLFPNAFIVFITNSRLGYASSIQYSYKNKSEQMKYASSLISTPIIDWAAEGSISFSDYEINGDGTSENPYNITASSEYTSDSMHPNDKGAELLARALANKIVGFGITKFK